MQDFSKIIITFVVLLIHALAFYSLFLLPIEAITYFLIDKLICSFTVNIILSVAGVLSILLTLHNTKIEHYLISNVNT